MAQDAVERPDYLIIGAGVIGCAIARELALRGAGSIAVVDGGVPGAEASGAAAGVLAVASSRAPRGAVYRLKRASAALFPDLVAALRAETGVDVEYRDRGLLELALTERDAGELGALVAKRRADGQSAELLDAAQVRAFEPLVSDEAIGGAFFAGDHALNNARLVTALQQSAEKQGVRFLSGRAVRKVEREGRRLAVVRAGEDRFEPGEVIVAAGLGSRAVGELLKAKMPIRADRGEMIALRPPVLPQRTTVWGDGYLVPRNDGELLIGATSGRGETEKVVTDASLELLLRRAVRMLPSLRDARPVRQWAGLRPMCTLRRPIIGPVKGYENVTAATGHHRSGVLLAPITAILIAEILLGEQASLPIAPFKYRNKP
jgi:glycine oxidase